MKKIQRSLLSLNQCEFQKSLFKVTWQDDLQFLQEKHVKLIFESLEGINKETTKEKSLEQFSLFIKQCQPKNWVTRLKVLILMHLGLNQNHNLLRLQVITLLSDFERNQSLTNKSKINAQTPPQESIVALHTLIIENYLKFLKIRANDNYLFFEAQGLKADFQNSSSDEALQIKNMTIFLSIMNIVIRYLTEIFYSLKSYSNQYHFLSQFAFLLTRDFIFCYNRVSIFNQKNLKKLQNEEAYSLQDYYNIYCELIQINKSMETIKSIQLYLIPLLLEDIKEFIVEKGLNQAIQLKMYQINSFPLSHRNSGANVPYQTMSSRVSERPGSSTNIPIQHQLFTQTIQDYTSSNIKQLNSTMDMNMGPKLNQNHYQLEENNYFVNDTHNNANPKYSSISNTTKNVVKQKVNLTSGSGSGLNGVNEDIPTLLTGSSDKSQFQIMQDRIRQEKQNQLQLKESISVVAQKPNAQREVFKEPPEEILNNLNQKNDKRYSAREMQPDLLKFINKQITRQTSLESSMRNNESSVKSTLLQKDSLFDQDRSPLNRMAFGGFDAGFELIASPKFQMNLTSKEKQMYSRSLVNQNNPNNSNIVENSSVKNIIDDDLNSQSITGKNGSNLYFNNQGEQKLPSATNIVSWNSWNQRNNSSSLHSNLPNKDNNSNNNDNDDKNVSSNNKNNNNNSNSNVNSQFTQLNNLVGLQNQQQEEVLSKSRNYQESEYQLQSNQSMKHSIGTTLNNRSDTNKNQSSKNTNPLNQNSNSNIIHQPVIMSMQSKENNNPQLQKYIGYDNDDNQTDRSMEPSISKTSIKSSNISHNILMSYSPSDQGSFEIKRGGQDEVKADKVNNNYFLKNGKGNITPTGNLKLNFNPHIQSRQYPVQRPNLLNVFNANSINQSTTFDDGNLKRYQSNNLFRDQQDDQANKQDANIIEFE